MMTVLDMEQEQREKINLVEQICSWLNTVRKERKKNNLLGGEPG